MIDGNKGAYSLEEVALNIKLKEECSKETPDLKVIEELLQRGADPLGGTAVGGVDAGEHVYGEVVYQSYESWNNSAKYLPQLTRLFLNYGMDVEQPRIPYDREDSTNPLWSFAFTEDMYCIMSLKMLLDKGISVKSIDVMVEEIEFQMKYVFDNPNEDRIAYEKCVWRMKVLMLCASYDYLLEDYEILRNLIGCGYNEYDLRRFKNWDEFDYEFDTSYCNGGPSMINSVVNIYEKKSGRLVWRTGLYMDDVGLQHAGII